MPRKQEAYPQPDGRLEAGLDPMALIWKPEQDLEARKTIDQRVVRALNKLWPHYYTLSCLAIFSAPVISSLHLTKAASVQYWIGDWGLVAIAIPWLLASLHGVHLRNGEPRLLPVIFTTLVPAIVLGVIANIHLSTARHTADVLLSKDCTTWDEKRGIQRSWTVAAGLYERCVNRTTAEHGLAFADGLRFLRLQDCIEYARQEPDVWAGHRRAWEYLRQMEERHECAGWCWQAVPLWTFQAVKDPCANTAGMSLLQSVSPAASRMLTYNVVIGIISIFGIMQFGWQMRRKGIEWGIYFQ